MSEFPGQFKFDELLDMPEDVRLLVFYMSQKASVLKMAALMEAINTGKVYGPYLNEK